MIAEVARGVLAEMEAQLDALRSNLDLVDHYQTEVFERQIEAEVKRLTPLVEEGGFIGFCDHRVPPDVPLENYLHYLDCVRKLWGKGVNLKPMGAGGPPVAAAEEAKSLGRGNG